MPDALDEAMKMNGILAKRPLRDLLGIGGSRPTHFVNGVAIIRLCSVKLIEAGILAYGIFFEAEPDAWYFFEPNRDTQFQIHDA